MSFLSQLDHNNKHSLSSDLKKQSFSNLRLSPLSTNKSITTTITSTTTTYNTTNNDIRSPNRNYKYSVGSTTEGQQKEYASVSSHRLDQQRRHYFLKEANKMIISNSYTQLNIDAKYGNRSIDSSMHTNNNINNNNNKLNTTYLSSSAMPEKLERNIESNSENIQARLIIPKKKMRMINNDKHKLSNDKKLDRYPLSIEKKYSLHHKQPNNNADNNDNHPSSKRKTFEHHDQKNKKQSRCDVNDDSDTITSITPTTTTSFQPMISRKNSTSFININPSLPLNERRQYYLKKCNELIPSILSSKEDSKIKHTFTLNHNNNDSTNKSSIIPPPPLSSSSLLYSSSSPFSPFSTQSDNKMIDEVEIIKADTKNNNKPFAIKKGESFSGTNNNNNNNEVYPRFTSLSSVVIGSTFADLIKPTPLTTTSDMIPKKLVLEKSNNNNINSLTKDYNISSFLDSEFNNDTNMDRPLFDNSSFDKDNNNSNDNDNDDDNISILFDTNTHLTIDELFPTKLKVVTGRKLQSKNNPIQGTSLLDYIDFKGTSENVADNMDFFNSEEPVKHQSDNINEFDGFSDDE